MFLRRRCKTVKGARYDYWSLCESVRTAAGPRQRVVATLGKLTGAEETRPAAGWEELRALLEGRPAAKQMRQPRRFGDCRAGCRLWRELGLDAFWRGQLSGTRGAEP